MDNNTTRTRCRLQAKPKAYHDSALSPNDLIQAKTTQDFQIPIHSKSQMTPLNQHSLKILWLCAHFDMIWESIWREPKCTTRTPRQSDIKVVLEVGTKSTHESECSFGFQNQDESLNYWVKNTMDNKKPITSPIYVGLQKSLCGELLFWQRVTGCNVIKPLQAIFDHQTSARMSLMISLHWVANACLITYSMIRWIYVQE